MSEQSQPLSAREFLAAVGEHIEELRKRLLVALLALAVTTIASFFLAEYLLELITRPIGGLQALRAIEVTENVSVFMRVSLLSGFILAFPIILYEVVAFVMPGLEPGEKRALLAFIPLLTILFLSGVAFAYFVMLPTAVPFMLNFLGIQNDPRPASYVGFVTNLMFWVGMIFETPLVVFLLAKFHIVTAPQLLRGWRYAVVASAVLAAVITPTVDPVSMLLLMAPLLVLYLLSVLSARFAGG